MGDGMSMKSGATKSRLAVGVDVPWVTSWSEEAVLGVRPCTTVGGQLAVHQAERAGYGRPNYSKNHLNRQRLSVLNMLCPMCGAPTVEGDRWTQTASLTPAGVLRGRGLGHLLPPVAQVPDALVVMNAGSISPSHRTCVDRAAQHCPHLGAMEDQTIRPFPERWVLAPLWIEASPPPPAMGRTVAVVSFVQLCGLTDQTDPKWRRGLRAT
jgi:hypothetical protein